jgi:hypothetical protein
MSWTVGDMKRLFPRFFENPKKEIQIIDRRYHPPMPDSD